MLISNQKHCFTIAYTNASLELLFSSIAYYVLLPLLEMLDQDIWCRNCLFSRIAKI